MHVQWHVITLGKHEATHAIGKLQNLCRRDLLPFYTVYKLLVNSEIWHKSQMKAFDLDPGVAPPAEGAPVLQVGTPRTVTAGTDQ